MSAISSLVPARFLTVIAHLVIVIAIFWSRENSVKACLPLDYTNEEYSLEDTRLVVGLSVTLGLFAVELAGFFSGVSMFNNNQGLLCILPSGAMIKEFRINALPNNSDVGTLIILKKLHPEGINRQERNLVGSYSLATACHACGSVALLFFLFEQWTCSIYWWIFGFCSIIPALYEMVLLFAVFGLKKKPL
ncbi:hypothetical protein NFI96_012199 [Prochilodus magdalenae]|nr:hypothetical protein NFI96_012199 [Prochilodus magdalenae]